MSLHFLLKAEARTRSLVQVLGMSDDDAFTLFRRVRWGDGDEVVCPHCGLVHRHYFR
ncbi:MAG: transposase, partial [Candidatus Accumulibacter sp.]|uniref:transposase n=1 Tax=Accumulibacter sp. TaxID=2053492 RepID=UPI001AD3EF42|nr:transposase [Accumulibacter sp.]